MSYQSITIVGNIGNAPELRYTPGGQAVTNFNVATNRTYTKNEERVAETTWFRVSAWGKLAETCNQFLIKGSKVMVVGRLTPDENGGPRTYQRQDGTTAASFEITAERVVFLGSKQQGGEEGAEKPQETTVPF